MTDDAQPEEMGEDPQPGKGREAGERTAAAGSDDADSSLGGSDPGDSAGSVTAQDRREAAYRIFADRSHDADEAIHQALELGVDCLDLEFGFLTRIEDDVQLIVEAVGDHRLIQPGESCPLEKAYCRRTIEKDSLLSVQDARTSEAILQSAYDTFELGSYIGSKVFVDGDLYGTLCFADHDSMAEPFSELDEVFVELLGTLSGHALERRQYDRELRERNELLQAERDRFEGIADTSFDALFRVDTGMGVTYANPAIERVLGYAPEEILGTNFEELLHEQSIRAANDAFGRLMGGNTVENLELVFHDAAGEEVVLEVNGTPITDDDGEVTGIQGAARDVTERKEREAELRLKNRAIDDAEVGVTIADASQPDRPVTYVNDGFERLTGYGDAAALDGTYAALSGPATDEETLARLTEAVEADEPVSVEFVAYRANGTAFWDRLTISPVPNDAGEITHHIAFHEDITERKRTEQLIRRLNRVLRHNLRNDMNVVLSYSEILQEATDRADIDAGERIERTVEKLIDLSDDARELERVAQQDRQVTRLDLDTLLDRVAADCAPESATITTDVATDRDVCAGPELERAVAELVANAVEHDADPPTTVTIDARDDGEWVELTVSDDGPGIPEQEARVVQTGVETPLEHGSGLGLWLVNWIVTRYGGSFQIRAVDGDDERPAGTVATLRLPGLGDDQTVEDVERDPTILSQ